MAVLGLSAISAVLNLRYSGQITENFRRDSVLAYLLPVRSEANSTCTWDVKLAARNTAGARAAGADASGSDYSNDVRLQATIAWAHYEAFATITGTADRIARANGRYAGGQDLLGEELTDAGDELAVALSTHSYSGDYTASPVELAGLAQAVDGSAGTYAGIATASYATWVSPENTTTLATLTKDNIRQLLIRPFKDNTGKRPPMIVCPGNVYDRVVSLFDEQSRIIVQTVQTPMGQMDIGKAGFTGVVLDGVPIIEDRHCTANTMYALDPMFVEYVQVPPAWTALDPGQLQGMLRQMTGKVIPLDQITAAMAAAGTRLSAQINALAKTGDSTKLQLVLDCQLRVKRRTGAAKLTLT